MARPLPRGQGARPQDSVHTLRAQPCPTYRELIAIARTTLAYLDQASDRLAVAPWRIEVRHCRPLIERLITQSERPILAGETVPAGEKLVSLSEPSTRRATAGGSRWWLCHAQQLGRS